MTTNIYILELEGGRYYIGKTENVIHRYQQHLNGNGSAWTKKYKPISLKRVIENASPFDEDKYTKEYMAKYGIDKVRGGSYVEIQLSEFHLDALKMEIWGAKNLCTNCGRGGHFVKDCFAATDVSGNKIQYVSNNTRQYMSENKMYYTNESSDDEDEWECEYCHKTFSSERGAKLHENACKKTFSRQSINTSKCYKCGKHGHYASNCYISRYSKNYSYDSSDSSD